MPAMFSSAEVKIGFYGYGGGGQGGLLLSTGTVTNTGLIELGAGASQGADHESGGGGEADIAGVITNGGTIQIDGGTGAYYTYGGGGTFTLEGALSNSGLVDIQGGRGDDVPGNPRPTRGGVFTVSASGALLNTGTINVGGGQVIDPTSKRGAGGTLTLESGATLENDSTLDVQASAPGDGAGSGFYASAGGGTLLVKAGSLLLNKGMLVLYGGMAGAKGLSDGLAAYMQVDGLVQQQGLLTVGGGASLASLTLTGQALINNVHGTIENDGLLVLQSGAEIVSGTLRNTGSVTGPGELAYLSFLNDGTVTVSGGTTQLNLDRLSADAGAHGVFMVQSGGLLDIGSSTVDSSQTVFLTAAGAAASIDATGAGIFIQSSGGTLDVTGSGTGTLNARDTNLVVKLESPLTSLSARWAFCRRSAAAVPTSSSQVPADKR